MSDLMERYKIPGWKVRMRTFIIAEGASAQLRLNLLASDPPDKHPVANGHIPSVEKE